MTNYDHYWPILQDKKTVKAFVVPMKDAFVFNDAFPDFMNHKLYPLSKALILPCDWVEAWIDENYSSPMAHFYYQYGMYLSDEGHVRYAQCISDYYYYDCPELFNVVYKDRGKISILKSAHRSGHMYSWTGLFVK